MKRLPLISSVLLFILLCVSASFWVLQLMKPPARKVAAPVMMAPQAEVDSVVSLFGGSAAVASNYQLKGVVLANPMKQSVAIIIADGKPPQAYPINAEIQPGVTLSEVHSGYIMLLDNGISKRVELPQDARSNMQVAGYAKPFTEEFVPPQQSGPPIQPPQQQGNLPNPGQPQMPTPMPAPENGALLKAVER